MRVRDYIEMKLNGEMTWPRLNLMGADGGDPLAEEETRQSILTRAVLRKTVESYTHLDIEVAYEGKVYSTAFLWDDQNLLNDFHRLLLQNIGKSIGHIGNLEFPA